ncbi:DUF262 domain-containing protein [Aeromonas dhakensis]|uniref:DUF262 domain-containing protein n=1 Tax=Aeromonas dhakensis TaxID=196024 RepID=UPI00370D1936
MTTMTLKEQVSTKRREIFTDSYPMSIGEISNLYRDGEIYINPDFQRFYRWTDTQKVRLIESIMLGIPLPSIFVAQREDGVWELVDGLQRLSTIFSFMGVLKGRDGVDEPKLVLSKTDDISALEGVSWDSPEFDGSMKIDFKREKIDVKIIKKESDINTKFELFQRLNTGGSNLSDQEVRNCLLIMLNSEFFTLISDLSQYDAFMSCTSINDRLKEERFDMELVLRFIVQNRVPTETLSAIVDVNEFLTNGMREIAEDESFNNEDVAVIFKKTFDYINQALSDDAFKKWDGTRYKGAFSIAIFEVVTSGVYHFLRTNSDFVNYDITGASAQTLINAIKDITKLIPFEQDFIRYSGSGSKASYRLPKLIPLGQRLFVS